MKKLPKTAFQARTCPAPLPQGTLFQIPGLIPLGLFCLTVIGTLFTAPSTMAQELPLQNGFAAKVNGEVITLAEVMQLINRRLEPNVGRVPEDVLNAEREKQKPIVLRELIERKRETKTTA